MHTLAFTRAWLAARALAPTLAALLACAPVHADTLLRVQAVIARHITLQVAPPSSVLLTEADVARGYVDVDAPVPVKVRGNASEGYTLVFERSGDDVREVVVTGMDQPLTVSGAGAAMGSRRAPGRGMWVDQLQLRFRFALAPDSQPGPHAWPVQISLAP